MYKFIHYILVPLLLWAYLHFKTRKDATPQIRKLINTLGSTLLIIGCTTFFLDLFSMGINLKMSLIVLTSLVWTIYFYFFWSKKKAV